MEPHQGEDSVAKLHGLAAFAERNAAAFGRVHMLRDVDGCMLRLRLEDVNVRNRIRPVQGTADLLQAYHDVGVEDD